MKDRNYTSLHKILGANSILSDITFRVELLKQMEDRFQLFKINLSNQLATRIVPSEPSQKALSEPALLKSDTHIGEMEYEYNFREGQFFQIYAYLEDTLLKVCQRCVNHFRLPYSIEQLNGDNNFSAIKLFFDKSLLMDMDKLEDDFEYFENLQLIRSWLTSRHRCSGDVDSYPAFERIHQFSENRFSIGNEALCTNANILFTNPYFFFEILSVLESFIFKAGEYDLPEEDPRDLLDRQGYLE